MFPFILMLSGILQHILYPLKISENQRFDGVFRGYKMCCRIQEKIEINGDIRTKWFNTDWKQENIAIINVSQIFSTYNLYTESPSSSVPESEFIDLMDPLRENEGCGTSKRKCDASSPLCSWESHSLQSKMGFMSFFSWQSEWWQT